MAQPFSKFRPIVHTANTIVRRRLLDVAPAGGADAASVLIVCAPAGFGKTTLLAQLCDEVSSRDEIGIWLNCDECDVEPQAFLASLARACREAQVIVRHDATTRDILSALNAVEGGCTLFLDEYETASNPEVDRCVLFLAENLTQGKRVVIGARQAGKIMEPQFQLRGVVHVVDAALLRFSMQEVLELLDGAVSSATAQDYFRYTEGWPFALQLLRLRGMPELQAEDIPGKNSRAPLRQMFEYLAHEVFESMDSSLQEFLLQVCRCEEIDVGVANAARDEQDSGDYIWKLAAFSPIVFVEEKPLGARLHPLFRDFLVSLTERAESRRFMECHARVARYYARLNRVYDATKHAVLSGSMELATSIILDAGGVRLIINEGAVRLKALLELLPASYTRRHPRLRLMLICLEMVGEGRADGPLVLSSLGDMLNSIASDGMSDDHAVMEAEYVRGIVSIGQAEHMADFSPWALLEKISGDARARYFEDPRYLCLVLPVEIVFLLRYGLVDRAELRINELRRLNAAEGFVANDLWGTLFSAQLAYARGEMESARVYINQLLSRSADLFSFRDNALPLLANALLSKIEYSKGEAEFALARIATSGVDWVSMTEVWDATVICRVRCEFALGRQMECMDRLRSVMRRAKDEMNIHLTLTAGALLCEFLARSEQPNAAQIAEEIGLEPQWEFANQPLILPWIVIDGLARALFHLHLVAKRTSQAMDIAKRFEGLARIGGGELDVARALLMQATVCALQRGDDAALPLVERAVMLSLKERVVDGFVDSGVPLSNILRKLGESRSGHLAEWSKYLASRLEGEFRVRLNANNFFTPRERDVLLELARGHSTKLIARNLALSPETVKHYLKTIFGKLHVGAREEAVAAARRRSAIVGTGSSLDTRVISED
ncbi:LuxR C-terminal-related transcriptional regulator [Paraburkholderia agricolaris]|uniref:LuxR C-terminal-related transcriptional regulator n=1 Tax=Paraburkholderia agricolaris TaxID=2152888 RepID=A0ABW8ZU76_9BURK